jgi:hypothetical protein
MEETGPCRPHRPPEVVLEKPPLVAGEAAPGSESPRAVILEEEIEAYELRPLEDVAPLQTPPGVVVLNRGLGCVLRLEPGSLEARLQIDLGHHIEERVVVAYREHDLASKGQVLVAVEVRLRGLDKAAGTVAIEA